MEGRYVDRYHWPMGHGNRKTPVQINPDNVPARAEGSHLAVSQVAQELPRLDRNEWLKGLFAPETLSEEADRLDREVLTRFGGPDEPTSLEYGLAWARTRLQEGAAWRKSRKIF